MWLIQSQLRLIKVNSANGLTICLYICVAISSQGYAKQEPNKNMDTFNDDHQSVAIDYVYYLLAKWTVKGGKRTFTGKSIQSIYGFTK